MVFLEKIFFEIVFKVLVLIFLMIISSLFIYFLCYYIMWVYYLKMGIVRNILLYESINIEILKVVLGEVFFENIIY